MSSDLRPIERRVLAMREQGMEISEIAKRLRKTPDFIERVIAWTEIPRPGPDEPQRELKRLTPLERRVLDLRAQGEDHETIGDRFKRSSRYIRQVEGLAHFRKGLSLLEESAEAARDQG